MTEAYPILYEADVVVVGGGSAGALAAIAAGRRNADVLLLESQNALGGSRTIMGVDTFYGFFSPGEQTTRVVGGIAYEIVDRLMDREAAFFRPNTFGAGTGVTYDLEQLKILLEEMALEAGVTLLFHTFVPQVQMDGTQIEAVILANKGGLSKVRASIFIDTTGDGDIAARAGAPFELSGSGDIPVQSLSTIFFMGNVDNEVAFGLSQEERTQLMVDAQASGEYKLTRIGGSIHPTPHDGLVHANLTRIPNVDATDPFALTQAEIEGRRQVSEYVRFLKERHPGFEQAYLSFTASHVGVRETRRLIGEYVLTANDVVEGRTFEDGVVCCAAPIEDHHAGKDVRWQYVEGEGYYQIPYRSLLPGNVDNLIVAGRCLSATHEAQASARNSAQCMAMGEAAGAAAHLTLENEIKPRQLEPSSLLSALLSQNVLLKPVPIQLGELQNV